MIDFYDSHMTDILPDSIKGDPLVKAMSYAISNAVKRIVQNAGKAGVYAMIDSMDEKALDLLAVELRTKYYGKWLDPEEKKTMIKKTLLWYGCISFPFDRECDRQGYLTGKLYGIPAVRVWGEEYKVPPGSDNISVR